MATSQDFTEEQLAAARKPLWHQAGEPVLTSEAAREFIEQFGLVAFAPGRLQMAAPSLVEATLGAANAAPSAADSQVARDLVGRLVADGAALPLNLLGGAGDAPDFVASAAVFRYIFTLRGDKSWKQAPSTSGAVKVSPLALRVFETLTAKGAMTAAELANELGREVTETAIVRALNELWQMLRVLPLLGQGENATLWELTTRRFTKHIKAGVNAGQPTALSALISLYLQQSLAATTDEIETFLSAVAARSRVREVLHALVAARELSEVVVAGKTLLHVAGELPEFAPLPEPEAAEPVEGQEVVAEVRPRREFSETETPEPGRIRTFGRDAAPRTREGGDVAFKRKPFGTREGGERRPSAPRGERKPFDRERKPFVRREGGEGAGERRPYTPRGEGKPFGDRERRPFRRNDEGGERPARAPRPFGGDRERKPFVRREGGEGAGERRPYTPRGEGKSFGDRERRPFRRNDEGGERPARAPRTFGGDRERKPFVRREGGEGAGERRPYTPRAEGKAFGERERRPFRRNDEGGERPARAPRSFGGDRERKPFVRREGGEGAGERRPYTPRGEGKAFGERKPFVRRNDEGGERRAFAPRSDRPRRNFAEGEERPKRAFGGDRERKPFVRREGGEGGGERPARKTFAPRGDRKPFGGDRKPAGARKPFGAKPGGARKPFGAKPAGKFGGGKGKPGGFKPTTRKPKRETEE